MITASGHTSEMRRNAPRVVKRSGIQKSIKLGQVALAKEYVRCSWNSVWVSVATQRDLMASYEPWFELLLGSQVNGIGIRIGTTRMLRRFRSKVHLANVSHTPKWIASCARPLAKIASVRNALTWPGWMLLIFPLFV